MKKILFLKLLLFFIVFYSNSKAELAKGQSTKAIVTVKAEIIDKYCNIEPKNDENPFFLKINENLKFDFYFKNCLNKPKINISFDSKNDILKQNNKLLEKIINFQIKNSNLTLNTNIKNNNIKNFKNGYVYMNITIE